MTRLEERGERIFMGAAVPCVRSLNGRPKPEDVVDRGGMSAPLQRAVDELQKGFRRRLSDLTNQQLPVLAPSELKRYPMQTTTPQLPAAAPS